LKAESLPSEKQAVLAQKDAIIVIIAFMALQYSRLFPQVWAGIDGALD
jgi:hypothetical protein